MVTLLICGIAEVFGEMNMGLDTVVQNYISSNKFETFLNKPWKLTK